MNLREQMSPDDVALLEGMLASAAEEGARKALRSLGFDDAEAGRDVREMRALLSAFRDIRKEVWKTFARWATLLLLGVILFAVGGKLGFNINPFSPFKTGN